ncbi:unnamed protein product [Boreogadus saida]
MYKKRCEKIDNLQIIHFCCAKRGRGGTLTGPPCPLKVLGTLGRSQYNQEQTLVVLGRFLHNQQNPLNRDLVVWRTRSTRRTGWSRTHPDANPPGGSTRSRTHPDANPPGGSTRSRTHPDANPPAAVQGLEPILMLTHPAAVQGLEPILMLTHPAAVQGLEPILMLTHPAAVQGLEPS